MFMFSKDHKTLWIKCEPRLKIQYDENDELHPDRAGCSSHAVVTSSHHAILLTFFKNKSATKKMSISHTKNNSVRNNHNSQRLNGDRRRGGTVAALDPPPAALGCSTAHTCWSKRVKAKHVGALRERSASTRPRAAAPAQITRRL